MTEVILNNIYHLFLMSEASRLGIINRETYETLIAKLLNAYMEECESQESEG